MFTATSSVAIRPIKQARALLQTTSENSQANVRVLCPNCLRLSTDNTYIEASTSASSTYAAIVRPEPEHVTDLMHFSAMYCLDGRQHKWLHPRFFRSKTNNPGG
jgi:hypothetical protein